MLCSYKSFSLTGLVRRNGFELRWELTRLMEALEMDMEGTCSPERYWRRIVRIWSGAGNDGDGR